MPLPPPTLRTARPLLRPLADTDAGALFALHADRHVLRDWDAPPWQERARAERFIAGCRQIEQDGSGARLVLERVGDGGFVGRWQGFATEAAGALLAWAFETLDLNRVQAPVDTRNTVSWRVLEKLGFVREGTLREDCIVDGDVSDSFVCGLLRRDRAPRATS